MGERKMMLTEQIEQRYKIRSGSSLSMLSERSVEEEANFAALGDRCLFYTEEKKMF
jgi:hypothetical protein